MDRQADIAKVIDFWFGSEASGERGQNRDVWWVKNPQFDETVRRELGKLHEMATSGELETWADDADGALALIVLLDQVPRNIHRDTPGAFATDDMARAVTRIALDRGFDQALPPVMRLFVYLPLEHSEVLADQEDCVRLIETLGDADVLDYAIRHRDIVARFGRFPHRNAILGRESTPEEAAFLKEPGSSF